MASGRGGSGLDRHHQADRRAIRRLDQTRYTYAGNLPGMVGHWEDTRCANCREILVKRRSYLIEDYRLTPEGSCPSCFTPLPGRWSRQFEGQIASHPFLPRGSSRLVTIFNR